MTCMALKYYKWRKRKANQVLFVRRQVLVAGWLSFRRGCELAVRLGDPQMSVLVFVLWHCHPYPAACFSLRELIQFLFGFSLFYGIHFFLFLAGRCLFTVGSAWLGEGHVGVVGHSECSLSNNFCPLALDLFLPCIVPCVFTSWALLGCRAPPRLFSVHVFHMDSRLKAEASSAALHLSAVFAFHIYFLKNFFCW